ncbi:Ferric uptake regulator family protein [Leptospira santarosai]|uniref:Ferric uptake regulator family protein n=1 Tax=Leptospira santarosai TaxID=28183 RepID=A0A2P1QY99_9LEPT|nr:Ferric uptake regulator family protein [Leptospira santarosai]
MALLVSIKLKHKSKSSSRSLQNIIAVGRPFPLDKSWNGFSVDTPMRSYSYGTRSNYNPKVQ